MKKDPAVSAVLSETLMIALVLVLVPIVTISLMNQLPDDRVPTVNIVMSNINSTEFVHFYHKGGDWIKISDIQVIHNGVRDDNWKEYYPYQTFDLGNVFFVQDIQVNDEIRLIAKNAVIFSGVAKNE